MHVSYTSPCCPVIITPLVQPRSQYRKGAPSAYGIYRYESSKATPDPSQIIQPGPMADRKW